MPSINALKQRRNVVGNMKQAMKAMNLVATAKLRKTREVWENIAVFTESVDRIMLNAAQNPQTTESIYVKQHEATHKRTGYIVLSSDRGKCGSYNINICKAVMEHASSNSKNALFLPIGTKGMDFFTSQSRNIHRFLGGMPEKPTYDEAEAKGSLVLNEFREEIDELYIAYTQYHTVLNLEPTIKPILPISLRFINEQQDPPEMEYDPDPDSFLAYMVPMYLNAQIYGAMLEAVLCEQAARMVATDTAVNNAQELIEKLTLQFNRQRQSIITQEITEIVSGASALT